MPIDVEWNYKDISHVRFVHSHMAREYTYVDSDAYYTFDLQKVMGITVPQSTAFYSTEDNKLIAHTTLFFIIILVEVSFFKIAELQTRTITRYAVGSKSLFGRFLLPLLRFGITRNWKRFSADDRPVRERRGMLRRKGYAFDTKSPVDFLTTLNIMKKGVFAPKDSVKFLNYEQSVKLTLVDYMNKKVEVGESVHLGLQIKVTPNIILVFPRLCPHQGCSLDNNLDGLLIACPWHRRIFSPLCSISNDGKPKSYVGPYHKINYNKTSLDVIFESKKLGDLDWTQAWTQL